MGKKNYRRPFMSMEAFRANNYCAECDIVVDTILVAECAGVDHEIKITMIHGDDQWEGRADDGASSGVLSWNSKSQIWAYTGTLVEGHDPSYAAYPNPGGEFYNTKDPSKVGTIDPSSGANKVTFCDCVFANEWQGGHHHMIQKDIIKPGNMS